MKFPAYKHFKHDIILIVVIIIWGLNFPILKQVLATIHPFVVNVLRFIVSIAAILVVYALQGGSFINRAAFRANLFTLLLLGFLGYFLYQVVFIIGIDNTTAGNSAIIMASSPVWTALTALLFGKERLNRLSWVGLILSISGAIFISIMGSKTVSLSTEYLVGNVFILLAAICWGVYTAFAKPATRIIDSKGLTLLGLLLSLPFNALIAVPYFQDVVWSEITITTWLAIIYSGGLSTGLAVVLWTNSVKQVGATHTAVFGNLVPLVAIIASFFILGENITFPQLFGGSLIIGGLILMRLNR